METRWRHRRKVELKASGELVSATYRMLFADTWLLGLMFIGSLLAVVSALAVVGPAMLWGDVTPSFSITSGSVTGVLVAGAALGVLTFVTQLTTGAVVAAALLRSQGTTPTPRGALAIAWSRRRQILAWALMSTVVGVVVRMLERLGVGGLVAALTLNIGWAAATVFSMPVVIVEGTMPLQTIRRSARVLRDNLGATVFGNVRLQLPWMVATFGTALTAAAGAVTLYAGGGTPAIVTGTALVVVGGLGFAFCAVVEASLAAYLQTNLYRYATGNEVPGVDPRALPRLAGA